MPYTANGRTKTDIVHLYQGGSGWAISGPWYALSAGCPYLRHLHPGYELIFDDGVLHNDAGAHPAARLKSGPPDSEHVLWSDRRLHLPGGVGKPVQTPFPGAGAAMTGRPQYGFGVQAAPGALAGLVRQ